MDSADQRAGRAARLGPGLVRRLWDARDRLRPHREPEIARVDLAAPVLDLLAWGADPLVVRLVRGAVCRSACTRRFACCTGSARSTAMGRRSHHDARPSDAARSPSSSSRADSDRRSRRARGGEPRARRHGALGAMGAMGAMGASGGCGACRWSQGAAADCEAMRSAVTLRPTSPTSRCVMRSSPAMPIGLRSAGPVSTTGSSSPAVTARHSRASPQALTASTSWRWMSWQQSAKESASRESVRPARSSANGFSRRRPQSSTASTRKAAACVRRASNATMRSCSAKRRCRADRWRRRGAARRGVARARARRR